MSSERAGVHTSGALNREQARDVLMPHVSQGADYDADEEMFLDVLHRLEACVVPDPRLARIEALLDGVERAQATGEPMVFTRRVRAILRGDQ